MGTWNFFTSSAVFGKRTVLHTHWPTIDFYVIMLDNHAVSIKISMTITFHSKYTVSFQIHRIQHEFDEDQSRKCSKVQVL
ncbi:hypothetical protein B9Z55_023423 [Caenorhabditis nigoni]|nr:hypothetical protein B9Z55_023423 [Caenorhabditis nigoni]